MMLDQAVKLLLSAQNADGGWGALAGRQSNTENTALSCLALGAAGVQNARLEQATAWLVKRQLPDGSWALNDHVKEPSWATALAIIALCDRVEQREQIVMAGRWLLERAGGAPGLLARLFLFVTGRKRVVRLNQDLVGWPWTTGNFSWVEPTCYSMIALKKLRQRLPADKLQDRLDQAELMLYDRMCDGGGWNYGNAEVYDEKLWPYPDTTALALIATQEQRERKENQQSLGLLSDMALNADSGLALGWAAICLALYGQDGTALRGALAHRFTKTQFLGETKVMALTILALGDGARRFQV